MSTEPTGGAGTRRLSRCAPLTRRPRSASMRPGRLPTSTRPAPMPGSGGRSSRAVAPGEHLRGTVTHSAGLHWHRTRYHGLRFPVYLPRCRSTRRAAAHRLKQRLLIVVALDRRLGAGVPGRRRRAAPGTTTRCAPTSRARKPAAAAAGSSPCPPRPRSLAVLAVARWSPRWGWRWSACRWSSPLARAGQAAGKPLVGAAVVPPQYQPPTPEIITRALGALGIAGINEAAERGRRPDHLRLRRAPRRRGLGLPAGPAARRHREQILARREQLASGLRRPLSATWPAPVPPSTPGGSSCGSASTTSPRRSRRRGRCCGPGRPTCSPRSRSAPTRAAAASPPAVRGQLADRRRARPGQDRGRPGAGLRAALDPLTDLWMHELAGKGDLEPLAQVSHRYCSGLDDEAIAYAAESMRMLRAELDTPVAQAQGHAEGIPAGRQGHPGDGREAVGAAAPAGRHLR